MTAHGVYSEAEMMARHEIHMEKYCKVIGIEAGTLVEPRLRNSNLFPVNASGEVRFRSVVSFGMAGSTSTPMRRLLEIMKRVAERHGLICLLHEKPFAGVNGSGKHVNWSLSTDTGKNLFSPGKTPSQNALFLGGLCTEERAPAQAQIHAL